MGGILQKHSHDSALITGAQPKRPHMGRVIVGVVAACATLLVGVSIANGSSSVGAAVPELGFYCGGPKTAGICKVGINVYKFNGKTLVTAATRFANEKFVCAPSGAKGKPGIFPTKVVGRAMPLKANGSFTGSSTSVLTVYKATGRFTSPTKVDVTFSVTGAPVGPEKSELCKASERMVVTLRKQATIKGLPF